MNEFPNHKQPSIVAWEIDSAIAEKATCPECGGSCHYDSHVEDDSYLAFAVCNDCGYMLEF
jgi:transcription elongation factor Elf1